MNYSAVIYNKTNVRVYNSINNSVVLTINVGAQIVGSPIVNGNRVAIVTQTKQGKMHNNIFEIPSGKLVTKNSF